MVGKGSVQTQNMEMTWFHTNIMFDILLLVFRLSLKPAAVKQMV